MSKLYVLYEVRLVRGGNRIESTKVSFDFYDLWLSGENIQQWKGTESLSEQRAGWLVRVYSTPILGTTIYFPTGPDSVIVSVCNSLWDARDLCPSRGTIRIYMYGGIFDQRLIYERYHYVKTFSFDKDFTFWMERRDGCVDEIVPEVYGTIAYKRQQEDLTEMKKYQQIEEERQSVARSLSTA